MGDLTVITRALASTEPCIVLGQYGTTEAAVRELDGAHPSELLDGFTVPAEYDWLAVVARGKATNIGTGETAGRVTIVVAIDRAGTIASWLLTENGLYTDPPADGSLLELMHAAIAA